jgi:predicted nucleic acid-binding protein
MARYLLDTNTLSHLIDTASPSHGAVRGRLAALADDDEAALSVLSLYELHHWFAYDPARVPVAEEIVRDLALLPVPVAGAGLFGRLMRDLRAGADKSTVRRHAVDRVIAVTALDRGAALVSSDGVFVRLAGLAPDLRVLDWTAA